MTKRENIIDRLERGDTILIWANRAYVSGKAGKDLLIGTVLFWNLVAEKIIGLASTRGSMHEYRLIKVPTVEPKV